MGSQLNDFDAQKVASAPHEHNSWENHISPPGENTPPKSESAARITNTKTTQKEGTNCEKPTEYEPPRGQKPQQ